MRILLVFAIGSYVAGILIVASNSDTNFLDALTHNTPPKIILASLPAGIVWGVVLLAAGKLRHFQWLIALLIATPLTLSIEWMYFLLWPPDWHAGRLKIVLIISKSYWQFLVPTALASVLIATAWSKRTLSEFSELQSLHTPTSEG